MNSGGLNFGGGLARTWMPATIVTRLKLRVIEIVPVQVARDDTHGTWWHLVHMSDPKGTGGQKWQGMPSPKKTGTADSDRLGRSIPTVPVWEKLIPLLQSASAFRQGRTASRAA
jgi:hypothetical protein